MVLTEGDPMLEAGHGPGYLGSAGATKIANKHWH